MKQRVIALEEHYMDPEVARHFAEGGPEARDAALRERLHDLGALRLREMDEAGIDVQVLSHSAPSTQRLDAATGPAIATAANDRLHQQIQKSNGRFAGFAALPTANPKAAADELERAVTKLGFKGAMIHGLTWTEGQKLFIDDRRFWPIFERAQALDVPVYLHPAVPHPAVVEAYYKDYLKEFPGLLTAAWGFTVETATQGIRLVLSGMFEAYPRLKIILGHLGESLPFSLWRIDMALARDANRQRQGNRSTPFRDTFREHVWITTSGNFSTPALLCCVLEMGVDRILFSVDYPFVPNPPGTRWMEHVPLGDEDRRKILGANAERLLKL
jgi:2,3-dihydroxybenzoate decarboxylase